MNITRITSALLVVLSEPVNDIETPTVSIY